MFKVTFMFYVSDSYLLLCLFFRVHALGFADPGVVHILY